MGSRGGEVERQNLSSLRSRREHPRDVEGLRGHPPSPIDAMEYQVINKFGLTDFGMRGTLPIAKSGAVCSNAENLLLTR